MPTLIQVPGDPDNGIPDAVEEPDLPQDFQLPPVTGNLYSQYYIRHYLTDYWIRLRYKTNFHRLQIPSAEEGERVECSIVTTAAATSMLTVKWKACRVG